MRHDRSNWNYLVIGGGRMGGAIVAGMIASGAFQPASVIVANPGIEKRQRLVDAFGVTGVSDASEAPACDVVIVAVSPRIIEQVVSDAYRAGVFSSARLVISVAAGKTIEAISSCIDSSVPVVRVMPNMPLAYAHGTSAISPGPGVDEDLLATAVEVFSTSGQAIVIDESLQNAATAVSGSGPAYFALVVDAITRAGVGLGLDEADAYRLALGTMHGTAEMLMASGMSAAQLVNTIATPGGTTIAALDAMRGLGIEEAVEQGVISAERRGRELSR